jgi:imidazole glycerol-phosphate synthase subunit HisH
VTREAVIVDYGMGNVASVANMIRKVGRKSTLSSDPDVIAAADYVILPGVGAFDAGISALRARGLEPAITAAVARGARVMGICLGFQLLFQESEEGRLPGLGLIRGRVQRFVFSDNQLRVPHMGWNVVHPVCRSVLFDPDAGEQRYYFVHSYHAYCENGEDVSARCEYGGRFTCAIESGSVLGVQFHPEKSHRFGVALFKRYFDA